MMFGFKSLHLLLVGLIVFETRSFAFAATSVPAAPSGLTASATSSNKVNLSWHDGAGSELGFMIQRSLSASTGFVRIGSVGSGILSYSDAAVSASTLYYYRVAAYNKVRGKVVNSAFSNIASATIPAASPTSTPTPAPSPTPTPIPTPTPVPSPSPSPTPSPGAADPNAVVVSPQGSDANQCTVTAPCLSLERAQAVVRTSPVKIVYLRAGLYPRTKMLVLTAIDSGQTWTNYPSDPLNSATLDATNMKFSFCTTTNLILVQGGSNITISGLQLQNFVFGGGITVHGGTNYPNYMIDGCWAYPTTVSARNNIISNNLIHHVGSGADNVYPWGWFAGITTWGDVQGVIVKNNAVHDVGGVGISFGITQIGPANGLDNALMSNNVIYNANTYPESGDLGGIYLIDRTASSKGIRVENNYLRDYGARSKTIKGIYLDDNTSYVTVKGNIVTGSGTFHAMIHDGHDNTFINNIFDVGNGTQWAMLYQNGGASTGMYGNSIVSNIVIAKYSGTGSFNGDVWKTGYSPNGFVYPKVANNMYWNYDAAGSMLPNQGDIKDSSPVYMNPQLFSWSYNLNSTSPAFNTPVLFPQRPANWGQPGFWGPPGYVIPTTGITPSSPY